jgi:predicted transcriptional regulator
MSETKTLDALMERAASWPDEARAELVQFMIDTEAKHFGVYRLSDDERAAIRRGLDDVRHGRFASDEEIAKLFDRFRRTAGRYAIRAMLYPRHPEVAAAGGPRRVTTHASKTLAVHPSRLASLAPQDDGVRAAKPPWPHG